MVHVGDYLYRQGPCANTTNCTGINNASFPLEPGMWGDNWHGWYADFFEPSMPLLAAAPWIAMRGNHEQCDRGGHGYFLFLDPRPLPANWTGDYCRPYTEMYTVPFDHQQYAVLDSSAIHDVDMDLECPTAGGTPQAAVDELDVFQQAAADGEKAELDYQIAHFRAQIDAAEASAGLDVTNFMLSHHPMYAVLCDRRRYVTADLTLQHAMRHTTLPGFAATIHGHVHWFQALLFEGGGLPMGIIVGNGGTSLDPGRMAEPSAGVGMTVKGVRVSKAFTSSLFGYSVLLRGEDGRHALESLQVGNRDLPEGTPSLMWAADVAERSPAPRRLSTPVFV